MATVEAHRSAVSSLVESPGLYEVVDGEVREKVMGVQESLTAARLVRILTSFVAAHGLGEVVFEMMFLLDADRKLQRRPDVAFLSSERWTPGRRGPSLAAWDLLPDLAIEVVSPSDTVNEMMTRIHEYFRYGIPHVWIVHPVFDQIYLYESPESVQILRRGSTLEGSPLFPGLNLPSAEVFGEPGEG